MLKETITYKDFDGNERTEDHFFNLTQSELMEVALELPDGLSEELPTSDTGITNEQAAAKIIEKLGGNGVFKFVKELMLKAYGIKSSDGRRFEKSEKISTEFSQTLAFDAMFMKLMSDDVAAANFVNAIIPTEVVNKIADRLPDNKTN